MPLSSKRRAKWSSPPTVEQKEKYFGDNLIRLFHDLFERKVKLQSGFDSAALHTIIGQLPALRDMRIYTDDNPIDLRISACIFKLPDSGGERTFSFISDVCSRLGLMFRSIASINEEILIGRIVTKMGYDPESKGRVKKPMYEPGILDPYRDNPDTDPPVNIIAMEDAAALLFERQKTTEQKRGSAVRYFQRSLNPMGTIYNRISKHLCKKQWVRFGPDCSLFFVAHIPASFYATITSITFLQGMLLLYSHPTADERRTASKLSTQLIGKRERIMGGDFEDLILRLERINQFWTGRKTPRLSGTASTSLEKLVDAFYDELNNVSDFHRANLESFTQRWIEITWRLAWHHAIIRLNKRVMPMDVAYARDIMMPLWRAMLDAIEKDLPKSERVENVTEHRSIAVLEAYEKTCNQRRRMVGDRVPRTWVRKRLMKKWKVSQHTANKYIVRAENAGFFKRTYSYSRKGGPIPFIEQLKFPNWKNQRDRKD